MTMWKLSAGTASVIGKKRMKSDTLPRTAYIMLGEKCRNHCGFCAQAQDSKARRELLSRITWPAIAAEEAAADIALAYAQGQFKRICLQAVNSQDSLQMAVGALETLSADGRKPVCVSSYIEKISQAGELIAAGAERICIAMDAATPELYRNVKGGDWQQRFGLLTECAKAFPGRMTTHLIVGLGETEEEAVNFINACITQGITVGLFAFTPIPGTVLADHKPPAIAHYRRVQIAHYLLNRGWPLSSIQVAGGTISGYEAVDLAAILSDGRAFETSGCPDCNRPYYNERPGGVMYNYPRPLTSQEAAAAVSESGIGGDVHEVACS